MKNYESSANKKFTIFFGNKNNCPVSPKSPDFQKFCDDLAHKHGLSKLVFQKQVHGTDGIYIDSKEKTKYIKPFDLERSFDLEGDFIITNQKDIGIGVLTADCLPLIFYDTKNHVAACIHAGWRSSVNEICTKAIQMMFEKFKFAPEDLQIYFGPCAKFCCYEVQPNFLDNLKNFKFKSQVIRKVSTGNSSDQLFFDNVLFNKLLLTDLGMLSKNMHFDDNHCTMCSNKSGTDKFHSYRRDGKNSLRQISFITLK
ncbi:MAG: peptidoglycan editing factor PgeF [bacterium]